MTPPFFNRRPRVRSRDERGFISVEVVAAVATTLLVLVAVVNIILVQYGRGVIRAAADEGARAGAVFSADPVGSCRERQAEVLAGLDKLLNVTEQSCVIVNGEVRATVTATFPSIAPGVPTFEDTATATSTQEGAPA
jgi:hypothetical protein